MCSTFSDLISGFCDERICPNPGNLISVANGIRGTFILPKNILVLTEECPLTEIFAS